MTTIQAEQWDYQSDEQQLWLEFYSTMSDYERGIC